MFCEKIKAWIKTPVGSKIAQMAAIVTIFAGVISSISILHACSQQPPTPDSTMSFTPMPIDSPTPSPAPTQDYSIKNRDGNVIIGDDNTINLPPDPPEDKIKELTSRINMPLYDLYDPGYGIMYNKIVNLATMYDEMAGFEMTLTNPNDISIKIESVSLRLTNYDPISIPCFQLFGGGLGGENESQLMVCTIAPNIEISKCTYLGMGYSLELTPEDFLEKEEHAGYISIDGGKFENFYIVMQCREIGYYSYSVDVTYQINGEIKVHYTPFSFYAIGAGDQNLYEINTLTSAGRALFKFLNESRVNATSVSEDIIEFAKRTAFLNSKYERTYLDDYYIESVSASSNIPEYPLENALDGNDSTTWAVLPSDENMWFEISYKMPVDIDEIRLDLGYHKSDDVYRKNSVPTKIKLIFDNYSHEEEIPYDDKYMEHYYWDSWSHEPLNRTKNLRIEVLEYNRGTKYDDICISELKVRYSEVFPGAASEEGTRGESSSPERAPFTN